MTPPDPSLAPAVRGALRPAAMCHGPGHLVRYGNPAFIDMFGAASVGVPAREALVALPREAFDLLDAVLADGRPYSRWIDLARGEWRITAAPRVDPGTGEVYGVAFHLRSRHDRPARSDAAPESTTDA